MITALCIFLGIGTILNCMDKIKEKELIKRIEELKKKYNQN